MKTIKNLISKICTFPNAIKAYMKARKCKRLRPEVLEFEQNREDNLQKAIDAIQSGDYTPGKYRHSHIPRDLIPCSKCGSQKKELLWRFHSSIV